MKFEINRLTMLEAAKNAARVAPVGASVDVLNGILVEGNDSGEVFLTATNFEVSIQQKVAASVEMSGAMLVNSRMLVKMLTLLSEDFVTFSAKNPNVITVEGGRCNFNIKCLPAKNYPKPIMPFPEETVNLSGICSLSKRTTFAVGKDENKPALQCVNVKLRNNAVHAAACDGFRLMMVKDSAGSPDEHEFLLPGRALQMLASISTDADVFEVAEIRNEIVFTRGDMIFTMKKLPGDYMDVNTVLKGITPEYSAVVEAKQMKEALGIMAVGTEGIETVNLSLCADQIVLRRDNDYSEAHTTVLANISKDTPKKGFYYDLGKLVKLFQVVDGKIKMELSTNGSLLVKTRNEVYFQTSIRSPVRVAKQPKAVKEAA
jgi:DNA polymerase-3 subunit beta